MAKKASASWEKKIVLTTSPAQKEVLLELTRQGNCRLIKALPLVQGYLCEFPMQSRALTLLSEDPLAAQILDDPQVPLIQPLSGSREKSFPSLKENWGIKKIQADQVWKISRGAGVKVAVLDSGIQLNHPSLREGIKGGINVLKPNSPPMDDNGHGTHVAGIIGARNRNQLIGVAPEVDLYAVKIFDAQGNANLSDIVSGLQWCLEQEIQLVNLSFGIANDNPLLKKAVQTATAQGLILVCAAGNEGPATPDAKENVLFPARYSETICVAALDQNNQFASYSSSGQAVDFAAPGTNIYSTSLGGKFATKSGTSFAAPHLTGLLALLLGYGKTDYALGSTQSLFEAKSLRKVLQNTAQAIPLLTREQQGAGLINAMRALSYLFRPA